MNTIIHYLIIALCIMIVICSINFIRAFTSYKLGDVTVKNRGYLTLSPKVHVDILGFILGMFFSYFWVNPIDVNPSYYKNRKGGNFILFLVPMISSLVLCSISGALSNLLGGVAYVSDFFGLLSACYVNFFVFNLIPVQPLYARDLLKSLLPINKSFTFSNYEKFFQLLVMFLLITGLLNGVLTTLSSLIFSIVVI